MTQNALPTQPVLGLGTIGLGRPWGHQAKPVPSEQEVENFLAGALELGIRFFDTAPCYGSAETRLGRFLVELPRPQRESIIVATKFGEFWNAATGGTFVDFSYDALARSLESSLRILGKIDVLQVHKAEVAVLSNTEVKRALELARSLGVSYIGASIKDAETGDFILSEGGYNVVQIPLNRENQVLLPFARKASDAGVHLLINRPYNMGKLAWENSGAPATAGTLVEAMSFVCRGVRSATILSGTTSLIHLEQNLDALREAVTVNR